MLEDPAADTLVHIFKECFSTVGVWLLLLYCTINSLHLKAVFLING